VAAASAPRERNDWNASRVDTAPKAWTRPPGRYHHHVSSSPLPTHVSSSYPYHRHSFRHLAMPSSAFFLRAGLALVSFTTTILQASAQDPGTTSSSSTSTIQTATPNATWRPRPTCSAGSGDPTYNNNFGGGGYTDKFGGLWDARCSNTLPNGVQLTFGATGGTNGQGWYGCAKGCAKRPLCTAFQFNPNYANANAPRANWGDTVGSGTCTYFSAAGAYQPGDQSNPTAFNALYGATHLIRANTQLPVSQRHPSPKPRQF